MILAFQTGKGSTDNLLKNFVENNVKHAKYCLFDENNAKRENPSPSGVLKKPPRADTKHMWKDLIDTPEDQVTAYMFWGFMRNTKSIYDMAIRRNKDFYFLDHAYIYHKKHSIYQKKLAHNPYFRMVKNEFVLTSIKDTNDKRLLDMRKQFKNGDELDILPWKKNGNYILIIPPSPWLCSWLNINPEDLMNQSIEEIKKHTDRKINIRHKKPGGQYNSIALEEDIDNAWAVVSFQSSVAVRAINRGVPSFLMKPGYSVSEPMSLTDLSKIETPHYPDNRYEWLSNICNHQFLKQEIFDGSAYRYLNDNRN
jgi:hypothetical protein